MVRASCSKPEALRVDAFLRRGKVRFVDGGGREDGTYVGVLKGVQLVTQVGHGDALNGEVVAIAFGEYGVGIS
jgi:hypothetical protein